MPGKGRKVVGKGRKKKGKGGNKGKVRGGKKKKDNAEDTKGRKERDKEKGRQTEEKREGKHRTRGEDGEFVRFKDGRATEEERANERSAFKRVVDILTWNVREGERVECPLEGCNVGWDDATTMLDKVHQHLGDHIKYSTVFCGSIVGEGPRRSKGKFLVGHRKVSYHRCDCDSIRRGREDFPTTGPRNFGKCHCKLWARKKPLPGFLPSDMLHEMQKTAGVEELEDEIMERKGVRRNRKRKINRKRKEREEEGET